MLVESMSRVKTKYPLHVLVTDNVSEPCLEILRQLGVTYSLVETITTPDDIYEHNLRFNAATAACWRDCWTKFRIFDQTQFDKIVFLDADIMVLKNLDHLFKKPHMTSCLDGEYFNIWPGWDHFNSGCIVIEPSHELFEDILNYGKNLKEEDLPEYIFADQEVLNFYFKDWPEKKELHLNKYYDIFAPYVLEEQVKELDKETYFIHYVGRKPWTFWYKTPNEIYTEHYYIMGKEMAMTRMQSLDWEKIRSYVKLTVYAICKDEISDVKQWIECFTEADYCCVLDTGSKDGTLEYLVEAQKTHPNLIVECGFVNPWRFDSARNLSMTLIPKDTVMYFMADLDEIIKEPGWAKIAKDTWEPMFDRGMYAYNRDVDGDTVIRQIPEYRFHSKEWAKWVNVVHEALVDRKGEKQFFVETCTKIPITVWHYPHKSGNTNYMELCELQLEEYPDDWVMRLQLAIEYEIRNENDKAVEQFTYILMNENPLQDFEKARCYLGIAIYYLKTEMTENALAALREGRLQFPRFCDNYIQAAEIYYNTQNFRKAIELCKASLIECEGSVWCNKYDINTFYPYYIIGLSYGRLGELEKSVCYLSIAASMNTYEPDVKKYLDESTEKLIQQLKQ